MGKSRCAKKKSCWIFLKKTHPGFDLAMVLPYGRLSLGEWCSLFDSATEVFWRVENSIYPHPNQLAGKEEVCAHTHTHTEKKFVQSKVMAFNIRLQLCTECPAHVWELQ